MSSKCMEKNFNDNLSVLITNIIFANLKRLNSLVSSPDGQFKFEDLQKNFDNFNKLLNEILTGSSAAVKLFSFAYVKLYLAHYIELAKPED